jgi:hypothetical protein
MDVTSLAAAMVGAQAARGQSAIAAQMIKMNAQADTAVVQMLDAAAQNASRLANLADGTGTVLDVSV